MDLFLKFVWRFLCRQLKYLDPETVVLQEHLSTTGLFLGSFVYGFVDGCSTNSQNDPNCQLGQNICSGQHNYINDVLLLLLILNCF